MHGTPAPTLRAPFDVDKLPCVRLLAMLPPKGDDWVGLCTEPLPLDQLASWPVLPGCGAVVLFAGTVRDHSEGRPGVVSLEYEAYEAAALAQMDAIDRELRSRWPETGRLAIVHRTGLLAPGDVSVVVSVSSPHRRRAFAAASFGIDAVKARAPIWKHETWHGGSAWGIDVCPIEGASTADLLASGDVSR